MTSLIRRSLILLGCVLAAASCTSDTPSYSIQLEAPDTVTLTPGESTQVPMTLTRLSQASGEVLLSFDFAPEGVTLEPSEFVLPAGQESLTITPTLSVALNTPASGLNEFFLVARDAENSEFATGYSIYLVILEPPAPQPDFSISVEPRQATFFVGQSTTVRVTLTRSQGFTGPVTLTLEAPSSRIRAEPVTIAAEQTVADLFIVTERSTTAIPVITTVIATSQDGRQATTGLTLNLRR